MVGPTAVGKSTVALAIATRLHHAGCGAELVSADSMAVYRGMDLGTATPEGATTSHVPHHLIDVADPTEEWNVARFQRAARHAVAGIERRGRRAIVVGGTGLYVQALVDDLDLPAEYPSVRAELEAEADTAALYERLRRVDPDAAERMESSNRRRIIRALEVTEGSGRPFSSSGPGLEAYPDTRYVLVGLDAPVDVVDTAIEHRVGAMMAAGWLDEVERLLEVVDGDPTALSRTASQAIGYRELLDHLAGSLSLDEATGAIISRTRRFARRQRAWFRRDPRIRWFVHWGNPVSVVDDVLEHWTAP